MSSRHVRSRTWAGGPGARFSLPMLAGLLLASLATPLPAEAAGPGSGASDPAAAIPPDTARSNASPARARPAGDRRIARPPPPRPTVAAWASRVQVFASLLAFDEGMQVAVRDGDAPTGEAADAVARWAERLGDWHASLPLMAVGSLGISALTEGGRGLKTGTAMLAGIVAGSMANEGLNHAVGRSRPLEGEGAYEFRPFTGHASFPSGHTAFAFSFAGAVDAATDGWLPAAAAYGAAGLTGLSRMYHDKHWLSDVVVGAAVGTVVSRRVTRTLARWMGVGEAESERRPGDGAEPIAGGADGPPETEIGLLVTPRAIGLRLRF